MRDYLLNRLTQWVVRIVVNMIVRLLADKMEFENGRLYDARQIIASAWQVGERQLLHSCSKNLGGIRTHLQPPRHSRLNNGPVGQEHGKEHLSQRSLDRVRKANKPFGVFPRIHQMIPATMNPVPGPIRQVRRKL